MSKFDVILLFVGGLIAGVIGTDAWLIAHGLPEFGSGVWTLLTAVSTGEVVTFSVYRMIKVKGGRLPTAATTKHPVITDIENQENQDEQQT